MQHTFKTVKYWSMPISTARLRDSGRSSSPREISVRLAISKSDTIRWYKHTVSVTNDREMKTCPNGFSECHCEKSMRGKSMVPFQWRRARPWCRLGRTSRRGEDMLAWRWRRGFNEGRDLTLVYSTTFSLYRSGSVRPMSGGVWFSSVFRMETTI